MELLAKLGINWTLLIAQIVNFLIVLGVLTYFVYRPFLDLLDKRRAKIAKSMEDAKRIENQMQELEAMRMEELKKLDRESGEYLEKIRAKAAEMQEQMISSAKREAEGLLVNAQKRIEEERRKMFEEVMATVNRIVIRMTEKILEREFSAADQERILKSFQEELPRLLR